jgi:hypothetical protein
MLMTVITPTANTFEDNLIFLRSISLPPFLLCSCEDLSLPAIGHRFLTGVRVFLREKWRSNHANPKNDFH